MRQLTDRFLKSIQYRIKQDSFLLTKSSRRENGGGQKDHVKHNQESRIQIYARPENTYHQICNERQAGPGQRCNETRREKHSPRISQTGI